MFLKKIVSFILPSPVKNILYNFYILSVNYGQYKSISSKSCIDSNGKKIPWYTYSSVEYISNIDFSEKVLFEYGSGNSSAYWAERSKAIISVEDNKSWFEVVYKEKLNNQKILLAQGEAEYVKEINAHSHCFDVVVIDGVFREKCIKNIIETMPFNKGFMIIFDNSDRYPKGCKLLRESLNLIQVDFHGFGPINSYTWTTSIFFSRDCNLTSSDNKWPHLSIAGLNDYVESEY